jgi:hypothetical protein
MMSPYGDFCDGIFTWSPAMEGNKHDLVAVLKCVGLSAEETDVLVVYADVAN